MKFVVPLVAFGEWHVALAELCLESLGDTDVRVIIYTDRPEAFPKREVRRIDPASAHKHTLTSRCYADALALGHPIVPVAADMLCSVGMLAALARHAETKRMVVCPVLRAEASAAMRGLRRPVTLEARELIGLALRNLHPRQLLQFWENIPAPSQPTTIYREVPGGVSARCFHMHPIMLRLDSTEHVRGSLDATLVNTIAREDVHVVTDSDELAVVDLSDRAYIWENDFKFPVDPLDWVRRKTNAMHRWFFTHECALHTGRKVAPTADARLEEFARKVAAL